MSWVSVKKKVREPPSFTWTETFVYTHTKNVHFSQSYLFLLNFYLSYKSFLTITLKTKTCKPCNTRHNYKPRLLLSVSWFLVSRRTRPLPALTLSSITPLIMSICVSRNLQTLLLPALSCVRPVSLHFSTAETT